jgi:N-acetylglucosaminyl-diphospho-decaprenol L-rhamnosyltransferase
MVVDVSILIVAFRSAQHMPRLAAALTAQSVQPRQILVLENGSPDGQRVTDDMLPASATLVESEVNLGFAAGNNRLAREARGEWLILLNPDAFPDPDWLESLLEGTAAYPFADLFGCTQRADGSPGVLDGAGDVYHLAGIPYRGGYGRAMDPPADGEVFAPCGAALMIRRSVFEDLGGFDEDYFCYVEDVDLGYRARLAGHRAVQLLKPQVSHVGYASSARRSEFATYHGTRNRLSTFLKNTPLLLLVVTGPLHMLATLLLWGSAARFGQFILFGRALRDSLASWPTLKLKRREVQASRTVSLLNLVGMMAWSPIGLLTRAPLLRPLKSRRNSSSNA